MDENICEQCGTRNEPGAQFCVVCQAYLPWNDTHETDLQALGIIPGQTGSQAASTTPPAVEVAPVEPIPVVSAPPPVVQQDPVRAVPTVSRVTPVTPTVPQQTAAPIRVIIEPTAVEVVPGGEEERVEVQIYNLSQIVDAYVVSTPDAPSWLTSSSAEVRLLPNGNETAALTFRIATGSLAPAGTSRLLVRVQSVAHPEVIVEEYLDLTVPAIETPMVLRLEPSVVRVRDDQAGRLQASIDNSAGNQLRRVTLNGRDTEGVVRFFFSPGVVDVPAGGRASVSLRIEAPTPESGQQSTRQLTISASDGSSEVEATATFIQLASVEVPLTIKVEPSLVKVRDSSSASVEVVIDNRRGSRTRRVFLGGSDPERAVHFSFSPPSIDVLAGEVGRARLKLEAPPPPAGQESSRIITVLASSEGTTDIEATATFTQSTSAAAVETPVTLRLEPSIVRVRDTAVGQMEVVIDNRSGNRVRRVFLSGRDPERAVRFTFSPPSIDVLRGEMARVRVRMEARLPDPGTEATRQITVIAADGTREVETNGSFVQATSAAPVETPVALKIEPSLLRVRDSPSGQFQVIVDNRQGIRARRVTLAGTDPERALGFSFWPQVIDIQRGQVARATARVDAYPPEPGKEVTRQFSVSASDGAKEVETDGTFIQISSPPPPDEPLTVRLEPSVVRVRNRGGGSATVVADNRGGSRPRRVYFNGHDPERVVRFSFAPQVMDLGPGQMGTAQLRISAPRPDGGEEAARPFTVVASDGVKDTEATGSFVQESSDRRPLWRILLTLLGGAMMIGGALLLWTKDPDRTGLRFDIPELRSITSSVLPGFPDINLQDANRLGSVGALIIVLGIVAIIGLTGASGRLTRLSALVAAVLVLVIAGGVLSLEGSLRPGEGLFLVLAGCVIAFIGGVLAKPSRR